MAQLDDKSRKALHQHLNKKIETAQAELKKLTHYTEDEKDPNYNAELAGKKIPETEIPKKKEESIEHLHYRIMQMQMSLRLAFNTNWIVEQREEDIEHTAKILKEDFGPGVEMDEQKKREEARFILRLNKMTKAKKCNRKGCYTGRGYTGLNTSTGEFSLCKCTLDTINYYKLHD